MNKSEIAEVETKLVNIAAAIIRREYLPNLERCRTIADARAEIARFDDKHISLSLKVKEVADELRERAIAESQAWIPVEEKLPDEDERISVWNKDTGEEEHATFESRRFIDESGTNTDLTDGITHWKPLADPPKGNEISNRELGDGEPSSAPPLTLNELLESARHHVMSDEEKEAQRQSWVRGEMALSESERGMTSVFPPSGAAQEVSLKEILEQSKREVDSWPDTMKNQEPEVQEVSPPSSEPKKESKQMNDEQIKHMVDRFLGWRLPENFNPDGGISFKPIRNEKTPWPAKNEPTGTNLFDAMQAEAMIRYLVDGLELGDTRELKAALRQAKSYLKVALQLVADNPACSFHRDAKAIIAEAEKLLGLSSAMRHKCVTSTGMDVDISRQISKHLSGYSSNMPRKKLAGRGQSGD